MLAAVLFQIFAERDIFFNVLYLCLCLSQLLILSWNANEILLQSTELSQTLYESKWVDQNETIKACMQIMVARCLRPLSLTIGPFGSINLDVAISRIKLAYTCVSVITGKK
ncbi:odorant receptor 49b-like [Cylas formicarius]|uniref:odorant receptor 49b-like n=1 Tax=Cylas formicarius TaxID=197179 RepID=UPI00295854D5|nr:odorant receptor 49b-like [Cylas formicarius]